MVQQQSVNTGDRPDVVIEEVNGDLRLMGWDRSEVMAKAEDNLDLQQDGNTVRLRCDGQAIVRVPSGATLQMERVHGDTRVKSVTGAIRVANASGDCTLRHVGVAHIENAAGEVSVKHAAGELRVDNVSGDMQVLHVGGPVTVANVGGDLSARSVQGALSAGNTGGDMVAEGIQGALSVDHTGGDLTARAVQGMFNAGNTGGDVVVEGVQGMVSVDHTGGGLRVAGVQGDVKLGVIGGDANVSGLTGQLTAEQVAGDLNVHGASAVSAEVAGDATLTFAPRLGQSHVTANGDIVCRIPPEANATLHLESIGASIAIKMPGSTRTIEEREYELKLGNGEVPIHLTAHGDVAVFGQPFDDKGRQTFKVRERGSEGDFDFDFDFDFDRGFDFSSLGKQFENFGEQFRGDFGERIAQQAREAAERVAHKAQAKAEQAARKAEEKARRMEARVRHEEHRGRWGGDFGPRRAWRVERPPTPPAPAVPPEPPREPVSDEERLAILRMLEQKKISVEQAEQLLSALSGNQ